MIGCDLVWWKCGRVEKIKIRKWCLGTTSEDMVGNERYPEYLGHGIVGKVTNLVMEVRYHTQVTYPIQPLPSRTFAILPSYLPIQTHLPKPTTPLLLTLPPYLHWVPRWGEWCWVGLVPWVGFNSPLSFSWYLPALTFPSTLVLPYQPRLNTPTYLGYLPYPIPLCPVTPWDG